MMTNRVDQYGYVTIALHWVSAVAIVGLFAIGIYMIELTYYDPLYQTLPFVHKGIGILVGLLSVVGLVWKWFGTSTRSAPGLSRFETIASKTAHWTMYTLIGLIVFSGYLISTAKGSDINVLHLFSLPATVTSIPDQADTAGLLHEYLAYLLIAIVIVHATAALKHHFLNKDNTLRRMLGIHMSADKDNVS